MKSDVSDTQKVTGFFNRLTTRSICYSCFTVAGLYAVSVLVFYQAFNTEFDTQSELASVRTTLFWLLSPILLKYAIQITASIFYPLVESLREGRNLRPFTGKVSVLIPAYNEQVGITKTLESVMNCDYHDFEIIVLNDGSTDGTEQEVFNFIERSKSEGCYHHNVLYRRLTNGGKAKALNRGLHLASGEIIITVDADCVVDKSAINEMVKAFKEPEVGAVAGNVVIANRKKPIELVQQLEYLCGFFYRRADSNFDSVFIIGGAAAAYRKSTLDEVGQFDETIITEDIEMSTRILAKGYKTRYAANAVVYTEGPSELKGLCNQRLRWKYGRLVTLYKYRHLFFKFDQRPSVYLTVLLFPIAVYAEIALLLEGFLITAFYGYTIMTNDYFPLAFIIMFTSGLISMKVLLDSKKRFHLNLLLIAPVAWLVFYFVDVIEFQALIRSLKRFFKNESLEWQKWARVGIIDRGISKVLGSK